ncbi:MULTISPECIES: UDP-N-acetylmuramate:L-alanyl-gamma-D-glutamyl-meso-diaminopimelate ligase [Nitrosomonas]|uniref:UDP-N-acetylmuramate--L-alanyl-gamma-D-glutamyl-meso-2,6-diaminoheptandioate ligase n=1 Tax=Nitrosomonas europaea (strain ATCC 19718 / CIP 103999 / KCTC 2705 / NBRC 14298) TaxID=228410 RepID=Q82ST7_NITEU|nr:MULTISPECIES: UDP-N-acetylmuramate:L-alanyl-gamma-D-glutamyl-meso-diaminopimelate ligase [Nitrosomonas]CAD86129.1 mpl; UDP-N-acetylmuramate:L-alanyl-gamma-D-glutamyl-meso-diaminopimelate ligase transmembrane protein [Nitrosomonas europaea ATCC 19718]SDW83616.1 UDP-N-acetylmuramate: L-alanyl-gamma-D-glutamyl-meso-diaminopimelate ligase [Nitrosomonas europaea]SET37537.1 UDP-N-acetylmuramate: L-alanyl-gamma-D-glutamyl-meso-diaminopimelate ligase [Nitrosomonas europaea]SJZ92553.1 UDP-N-acetylmur
MHIHILGICGTFMGGLAVLARAAGHTVTGCDANVYPPMSTQLRDQQIELIEGYDADQIKLKPDLFVIGNVVSRGNPLMEAILDAHLPYLSGPQWLAQHLLHNRWVLAVAGTHGKTTTSSMLAWILEYAGLSPGFLIGGVPENFGLSARLGIIEAEQTPSPFFVIEADEYDTAFFDKRSKFVHYQPRTVVLNNLEYDHADIFPDLAAIERQFHHLIRIVPRNGLLVVNGQDTALQRVLNQGCWTPVEQFDVDDGWQITMEQNESLSVRFQGVSQGILHWELLGEHNCMNALAALAAARHAGVPAQLGIEALSRFKNVKRRMELRGVINDIHVYDDFAHHPTAIRTTLAGLRAKIGQARIIAVLEPRSNTMKLGVWQNDLAASLDQADQIFCYAHQIGWNIDSALASLDDKTEIHHDLTTMISAIAATAHPGDHILIMSNGSFSGLHDKLLDTLRT